MSEVKRPNIVVFMPDQLRCDSIGTFGKSMVKTPNFDRLGSMGAAFENTFVQHTVCTPSRCSIFTGWYPHVRGHRTLYYLLRKDEPNLMKYLRDAGYHVEWNGKNDLLDNESMAQGVDHRGRVPSGVLHMPTPYKQEDHLFYSFYQGKVPEEFSKDPDYWHVQNSVDFLKNRPEDKPFFLYIPIGFPHPPYRVEEPYFSMYDRDQVPSAAKADYKNRPAFMEKYHKAMGLDRVTEQEMKEIRATYYGQITRTDALFGKLLVTLEEQDLLENTAVFVFSDHGDYTGDYGLVEKWWTGLTDNLVNIPLIAWVPGMKAGGKKMDALVEAIDIFPTILEVAGVKDYHKQYGKSLLPLLNGETQSHRDYVFAEGGQNPQDDHCKEHWHSPDQLYHPKTNLPYDDFTVIHKAVMIRSNRWKYVKHLTDIAELYDLEADPREEKNLAADPRFIDVISMLEKKLLVWYMETTDYVPFEEDDRDGRGH